MLSDRYYRRLRLLHRVAHALGACSIRLNINGKLVNNATDKTHTYLQKSHTIFILSICWLAEFLIRISISIVQKNINSLNVGGAFLFLYSVGLLMLWLQVFRVEKICQMTNGMIGLLQHVKGKLPYYVFTMIKVNFRFT